MCKLNPQSMHVQNKLTLFLKNGFSITTAASSKMVAKLIKVFAHTCIGLSGEVIVKKIMTV